MRNDQTRIIVDNFSLDYLFQKLKESHNESIISEIYSRSFQHIFNYVHPKVSKESDTLIIVQDVYRILFSNPTSIKNENCLLTYLERLADGCLILNLGLQSTSNHRNLSSSVKSA